MKKIGDHLKNPSEILIYLLNKNILWWLDDKTYLKLKYRLLMKSKLNLDHPETFNEKLQWLKLNDRNPEYTRMVDKYESKQYVKEKLGEEYVIPLLGVYEKFDDIDFDKLPNQFIIKSTHDCGGIVICKNKNELNIENARKKLSKSLRKNYYYGEREWPYKNVKPRIIVEQLLENKNESELVEYNLFCFDGEPKIVMTCHGDKRIKRYNDFYDIDFNKLDMKCRYDNSDIIDNKPERYEEMLNIARKLSQNIPELRVDLYLCNDKIYVGELTFFHWGGFGTFEPQKWDYELGKLINLDTIN